MKRVSKEEMKSMQDMIDSMNGVKPVQDSNKKAESEANSFMDAMGMAEDEAKRRAKLKKLTGN